MATTAPSPIHREEPVTITFDATGKPVLTPDPFHVSKRAFEEVVWNCPSGDYFTVDFGNDSPFYESQFSKDCPCSGPVRRSVLFDPHKTYKYTVRVKGQTLDPGGVVDP